MLLPYIYHTLSSFRTAFSRERSFTLFSLAIIAFLASYRIDGVSSFCRFWMLDSSGYHALLHFFHSQSYQLSVLVGKIFIHRAITIVVESIALLRSR